MFLSVKEWNGFTDNLFILSELFCHWVYMNLQYCDVVHFHPEITTQRVSYLLHYMANHYLFVSGEKSH